MLGSVANHAWSEDSLYLRFERGGNVRVERESKHTPGGSFLISRLRNKSWTPTVTADRIDLDDLEGVSDQPQRKRKERRERTPRRLASKAHDALMELGEGVHATSTISEAMGVSYSGALQQLQRLEREGIVEKIEKKWRLNGTNGE